LIIYRYPILPLTGEFWLNLQTYYDLKMARLNLKPEDARRIKARRAA
jgi:plasmid maintenance system antidote protein VapI